MRRLIAIAAILVFMATASMGLASTNMKSHRGYWISGQVTAIENGPENSLVTMNLSDGQIFRFSSTNQKLDGIKIGDRIAVRDVKGWAAYIKKTNMKLAKSSPEKVTVALENGKVTSIKKFEVAMPSDHSTGAK